jgi:hypothetical protein
VSVLRRGVIASAVAGQFGPPVGESGPQVAQPVTADSVRGEVVVIEDPGLTLVLLALASSGWPGLVLSAGKHSAAGTL